MKVTKLGILGIILTIIICYILVFLNILVKDILLFFILPLIVSFIFDGLSFLNKKRINKEMQLVPFFLKKIPKMLFQLILIFLIMIFIASERYYKKTEVIQDLDNLVEHLENIHPDLYANIPKDSFNYILNDYKKNLPNKVTEFQLFKICSKLTSLFKDGHTKATIQYYFRRLQIIFINITT